ncbi:MAG TPA: pitrilysin family protein [Pyrinomonadaceae bacterium]|nr:pitrilysin family protein [Pyrinomonadaceae bacterium]
MIREMRIADYGMRISFCLTVIFTGVGSLFAQDLIPAPGPARPVAIPAVREAKLKNGLTVAVVEKRSVPIVTVQLLVRSGAVAESIKKAGLANITADMLTKGTKTRTAEQIAEEMEFLGASINSGAGWNSSSVTMSVTSDKLDQAMAIMADVVLNPSFKQEELDLLKSQTLDELKANLAQPAFLANYVASVRAFREHPAGGTTASVEAIGRADVVEFHKAAYAPEQSVIIFAGDISSSQANALAARYFDGWTSGGPASTKFAAVTDKLGGSKNIASRILVVDLPGSGQASVNFYRAVGSGRSAKEYYTASVLNSLLGGGYSSRLNQEIRIKRGLSYGAGSSFGWRSGTTNFSTRTQTKNQSAAEVAELVIAELRRLAESDATETDLNPRRLVLTGGFGRNLETTGGLTGALADLYSFGIPAGELNNYMRSVSTVSPTNVKDFASKFLHDGEIIIVGDYSVFKDDLAKRFPNMKIDVIKVDELNIESPTLRKSDIQ